MKSPLRWQGGKGRLAGEILGHAPDHRAYVETCCGGAAVFWAKPKAASVSEVLNDADGELVNFYYVLHKQGRKLAAEVDSMPYGRQPFANMLSAKPRSAFRRAVRFWYVNRVAFGAKRRGGSFGVRVSARSHVLPASLLANLDAVIERLRGVLFESVDVVRLVKLYDRPTTLFFLDPPYIGLSQDYACRFAPEDHDRLARCLRAVDGAFLLTYNDCREVRSLYRGCRVRRLDGRYTIGCNASSRAATSNAPQLLISNRPFRRRSAKV